MRRKWIFLVDSVKRSGMRLDRPFLPFQKECALAKNSRSATLDIRSLSPRHTLSGGGEGVKDLRKGARGRERERERERVSESESEGEGQRRLR